MGVLKRENLCGQGGQKKVTSIKSNEITDMAFPRKL